MIYIPKTVDGTNDFWTSLIQGTRMAAKEYNSDIEIMAPEKENDVEGQNRILEQAIEKHPDAILISPSSFTESDSLLQKAKDQGIRLTFIDSYTDQDIQDITVATDNVEAGEQLGEFAAALFRTGRQTGNSGSCKRGFHSSGKRTGIPYRPGQTGREYCRCGIL